MQRQFKELFERQGKSVCHAIVTELTKNANIAQQKGKGVPKQLQEAVLVETNSISEERHIEVVIEVTVEELIQHVVIRVKFAPDARPLKKNGKRDWHCIYH